MKGMDTDTTSKRQASRGIGELITSQQLAEVLGIPLATVYQWRMRGTGPRAIKVGKHVRYRVSDVADWLDAHTA
jgi:excisionase family DNA binding protein